jgi:hypothetical protein
VFLFPAGLYFCFRKLTDANIFAILYGVTSVYFSVRTCSRLRASSFNQDLDWTSSRSVLFPLKPCADRV